MKKTTVTSFAAMDCTRLWSADNRLLPGFMRQSDNSRKMRHYRNAAKIAVNRLPPAQREQILLYYGKELNKTQIGRLRGVSASAVCKSLKAAENAIKKDVELYMQIYDTLERDFLNEEDEF